MPLDNFFGDIFGNFVLGIGLKAFAFLFVLFYVFFALIMFRQIQLMSKAVPTAVNPFLKFVGIIQIGVALAFLFVVIDVF